MTAPSILAFSALTSSRRRLMYSSMFNFSGAVVVFGGAGVFVCATNACPEVRHAARNAAIAIARIVVVALPFTRAREFKADPFVIRPASLRETACWTGPSSRKTGGRKRVGNRKHRRLGLPGA